MFISVIISTKNRTDALKTCISALLKNKYVKYEIIIIDQSTDDKTHTCIQNFIHQSKIPFIYKHIYKSNLSLGRNIGIKYAKGDICAFTDDDCIVDTTWLYNLQKSFIRNPTIIGVFGKTLPYKAPYNHGLTCPCIFEISKNMLITKPIAHWRGIGFGNNMAFKKEIFQRMSGFKEWLGSGSIGCSAEDAEFALRLLINKFQLMYNPMVKIWHNRWLNKTDLEIQNLYYICGQISCYGYFTLQRKTFGKSILIESFKEYIYELKHACIILIKQKNISALQSLYISVLKGIYILRGMFVALLYNLIDETQHI